MQKIFPHFFSEKHSTNYRYSQTIIKVMLYMLYMLRNKVEIHNFICNYLGGNKRCKEQDLIMHTQAQGKASITC